MAGVGASLEEVERRALAGGLTVERRIDPIEDREVLQVIFSDEKLRRDSRVSVGTLEEANKLLRTSFEQYRVVPGYGAIFSPSTGDIEARIRPVGMLGIRERPPLDQSYRLDGGSQHSGRTITIGEGSPLLSMLVRPRRRGLSILLQGFSARTPETAKKILDEVGSALMFELDIAYEVPLKIVPAQEFQPILRSGKTRADSSPPSFPRNAYDPEPVALYMYGREARGMPLLEFLAYYQAVEFYFPRYSEAELRHRLEIIVKDPSFNPHRARDVGRLLGAVVGDGRRTINNERDQLKATIRACLQEDEIREFVGIHQRRVTFFADRRSTLTKCTIPLQDKTLDLRDAAANRVYDIRCKIVHTKDAAGQGEIELLLPNSPEARTLGEDIALLRMIATRVLVASSRELTI